MRSTIRLTVRYCSQDLIISYNSKDLECQGVTVLIKCCHYSEDICQELQKCVIRTGNSILILEFGDEYRHCEEKYLYNKTTENLSKHQT